MIGYGTVQTSSIYVCNLPPGTNETLLAEHFGQIGVLKKDKKAGRPKIWIYRDKTTNEPKGDATVTYEDPHAASAAVEWFDNKDFHGNLIRVSIAESKNKDTAEQPLIYPEPSIDPVAVDSAIGDEFVAEGDDGAAGSMRALPGDAGAAGDIGAEGTFSAAGRGRGRGEAGAKGWQQEGDWPCPNPSCGNINFSFRGQCNRCGTSRPAGGSGSGGIGGGRGKGRGGTDAARGRGPGGQPGLFSPNDWMCPMCGNVNWAKRTKCNICNTSKPGHNEGGVREGRAGGYKEFDEAEIEETKRRRRELQEDDGEMYDEFGNLKKKFRVRAKQGESAGQYQTVAGLGSAGWDKEELGVIEKDKKRDRGRDRGSSRDEHNGYRKEDDRELHLDRGRERGGRERERDRYGDRENEWGRERERTRDRERPRSKERDRERDSRERDRGDGWYREKRGR